MIRKIIVIIFLFFVSTAATYASEDFAIDLETIYDIQESGNTKVTSNVSLTNKKSESYAKGFFLELEEIKPLAVRAIKDGKNLNIATYVDGSATKLFIEFDDAVVGLGKIRSFQIFFEVNDLASKTGEVWEISIPRLIKDNDFRKYDVSLLVPKSFGNEAYVSPLAKETRIDKGKFVYEFEKRQIENTGISAGFGKFQVFTFSISYHLENSLGKSSEIEIAIPPDTSTQRMYYKEINPLPQNIRVDDDGNWLATYKLKPKQRLDISINGQVQIFASPRQLLVPDATNLKNNLKSSEYWNIDDYKFKSIANDLNSAEEIYDYVVNNLNYDYQRVKPGVERYGALRALENPSNALSMEFTDLFIALSRASGIPAREINGFAYTENPEIQPLSLVADVLHAWPEYWNDSKKTWVPVDPTWGSTTGGIDYFNKLDLRHFTFVIHGEDPNSPVPPGSYKLGDNPQKDVFVSFGQLPETRNSELEVVAVSNPVLPLIKRKVRVSLINSGPVALYHLTPQIYFDSDEVNALYFNLIAPFGRETIEIEIPSRLLGFDSPEKISIVTSNKEVIIPTQKTQIIIYNLIFLSLILLFIVLFTLFITGKIKLPKILIVKRKSR